MTQVAALSMRRKRWTLVAIVLLAAFLRLYRITDLPPGDGYDPAWYGVDALQILDGHLPVYLPTNIGREVLFSYLVALTVAIVGVGPHAVHLAAAIVGVLTVPATYLVGEALLAEEREPLRSYGGLVAALALAVSFWHQHWSRYGVRAILVPLLVALTMWALVRMLGAAAPGKRRAYAVAAGALLGLSLYTYQSARVLPVFAALVLLIGAVESRRWSGRFAVDLLLLTGTAALVFMPMGFYFVHNPGSGTERIEQTWSVSPERSLAENGRSVWTELVDAVRVVAIEGDNEVIHNLPGRPAMNAFLIGLLGLGTVVALARVSRRPYWILLLWLPAMSVTAFLTLGGQPTKRALGALPAIAILIATGALWPFEGLGGRSQASSPKLRRTVSVIWAVFLAGGFLYSAAATYRDYFLVWGSDRNLWTHFEGGRVAIGRYAGSLPADEVIYSSPEVPDHPSIVYNSGGRTDLRGYNGRLCTVYPAVTATPTTYIIVQHEESRSLALLRRIYPQGLEVPAGPDYFGQPYFTAYRIPAGSVAQITPQVEVSADWSGAVRFLGFDADRMTVTPGALLDLTMYSQSLATLDRDYVLFVHLMHGDEVANPATGNALWAQDDSAPCRGFYPTSAWHPGEVVRDGYTIQVPADAPSGRYVLEMGFYTWPDFQHLTTEAGAEATAQTAFPFGEVTVE